MPVIALNDAGIFRQGATFKTLDWAISAAGEVWPNGSKWLWRTRSSEHQVKIVGGVPVRDDGAVLHSCLSRYEWKGE